MRCAEGIVEGSVVAGGEAAGVTSHHQIARRIEGVAVIRTASALPTLIEARRAPAEEVEEAAIGAFDLSD